MKIKLLYYLTLKDCRILHTQRSTEGWKGPECPLVQSDLLRSHLESVAQDHIQMAFECSRLGGSTISLGNLLEWSVTTAVELFPDVWMESPVFQFEPFSSDPVTGHSWKFWLHLLRTFPLSISVHCKIPLSLFLSRLNTPSSLSLPSCKSCSSPLDVVVASSSLYSGHCFNCFVLDIGLSILRTVAEKKKKAKQTLEFS